MICSAFAVKLSLQSQHTGDSFIEPPDLFLCPWYLVTWSLYERALRIVSLLSAEDEDLTII